MNPVLQKLLGGIVILFKSPEPSSFCITSPSSVSVGEQSVAETIASMCIRSSAPGKG